MRGLKMTKRKATGGSGADYEVGYRRPPKSGQIKPGEVRNPFGRTGRPKHQQDLLLKVAEEEITANLNGQLVTMTQEEAAYRRLVLDFHQGKPIAMKLFMEHLSRRRPPLPLMPTAEDLAKEAAEIEEKRALAAKLVGL